MSNNKKKNKANLRYKDTKPADTTETGKKKKMTFMQWVKVTPVWYLVFGCISLGATFYGLFHPDFFASEGEVNRMISLTVFFALGIVMLYQGGKYIIADEDLPENKLFKMFSSKK